MNRIVKTLSVLLVGAALALPALAPIGAESPKPEWWINNRKSSITFTVNAKIETVTGKFRKFWTNKVKYKPGQAESLSGRVVIDVKSLYTKKSKRDRNLRSEKFFDVENHPYAIVTVRKVTKDSEGDYYADITLRIRGVERKYNVPVKIELDSKRFMVRGAFLVDRTKFKINGNIVSNAITDDMVTLRFKLIFDRRGGK